MEAGKPPERGSMINLNMAVMPLVRLMLKRHQFSWAQREEIAYAIQECITEYESLCEVDKAGWSAKCPKGEEAKDG